MNRFHERDFTKHSKYFKSFNGNLPFVVHPNVTSSFLMSPSHWWPFCHYPTDLGCTKTPHTYWDSCLWHHGHSPNFGKNFFFDQHIPKDPDSHDPNIPDPNLYEPSSPQPPNKHKTSRNPPTSNIPCFLRNPETFWRAKKVSNLNKNGPHLHLGSTRKNLFRQVLANGGRIVGTPMDFFVFS